MESTFSNTTAPAPLQCIVPSKKNKNKNENEKNESTNPNYNISEHIKYIFNKKRLGIEDVLIFDASSSQRQSECYLRKSAKETKNDLFQCATPFGSGEFETNYANPNCKPMSWNDFVRSINSNPNFFQHVTHTHQIEKTLQSLNQQQLYNIVFQCDGSFTDSFPNMLRRNIPSLQNVKSISVVYSPHTQKHVRTNLDTEIKSIMELTPSYIQFTSILMDKYDLNVFNNLVPTLPRFGIIVPKNHLNWRYYLFHEDLTAGNIAKYLSEKNPEVFSQMIEDLKNTIQTNPSVFECSDNIYILLYSIISCLNNTTKNDDENIFKEFIDWISDFKNRSANKNTQELLTKLIRDSRERPADIKWKQEQLIRVAIGFMMFNPSYQPQDLLKKIADGSCIGFCRDVEESLFHLVFTPKTKGNKLDVNSWLVPNPAKCSRQDAMNFFGLFFSQFGNYRIDGIKIYIIALQILTTDAEINNVILNLAKRVVLGENSYNYNLQMIGYSVQENTGNFSIDNPLWFSYEMSMLLFQAISQFGNKMFDSQENINTLSITNLFKMLIKFHKHRYSIQNNTWTITRNVQVPIVKNNTTTINPIIIGGIYAVSPDSWGKTPDPEPELPSVVIVLKKRKNGIFSCEYLDNVSKRNIDGKFLIYLGSSKNKDEIYQYLSSIKGKTLPDEEGLSTQQILKERFSHIYNNIMTDNDKSSSNYTGEEIQYKIVEKQITIPTELVCKIVGITNPDYTQLILKPSVPNRIELLKCVGLIENNSMELSQNYQFKVDGIIYELSQDELTNIYKQFQEKLFVRFTSAIGSRKKDCIICLCPYDAKKMIPLDCSHYICPDCSPMMTPEYNFGDFIEPYRHHCSMCRHNISTQKFMELCCVEMPWFNSWDTFLTNGGTFNFFTSIYRFCKDCNSVFEAGENACEDHRDTFPTQCEKCRTPLFFTCPNCEVQLQHAGGCSIIRCCVHGYHGCPDEEFYDYETDSYSYPYDYPDELKCGHGGCCGHVFDIDPEQRSFGN